jgi:7-cyano-7-deazaguanine synthase
MGSPVDKAVVLLSGGLDSAVTAALVRQGGATLYCLTVAYGQRHAYEIQCAETIARSLEAHEHLVIDVNLRAIGGSALTAELAVPKDRERAERTTDIPATYVPARNTIFLSLALAYAESRGASSIYFGANVLDYSGYPDCRPEFIEAFEAVARLGTGVGVAGRAIQVRAPLLMLSKAEIIRRGAELHVPFELTHSCYDPSDRGLACGRCDRCIIRREGFRQAGVVDSTRYAVV